MTKKDMKEYTREEREKNMTCDITSSAEKFEKTQREDTASDIYYKTECKLSDSEVSIPTEDSVVEAKDWVDNANKR